MDLRRTIEEIEALHTLEPELVDVFVEGTTDKLFLDWYLAKRGKQNVAVYCIDSVDVEVACLEKYNLPTGCNRSRVIALSCELAERKSKRFPLLCIADRDFEDYCPSQCDNQYLTFTDGGSIESYSHTPETLRKFLHVGLGGFPISEHDLINELNKTLERLFLLRLTNARLRWRMSWIPINSYIRVSGQTVQFREKEFVRAYLQKNYRWDQRNEFFSSLKANQSSVLQESRCRARGHDFAELLLMVVRRLKRERQFGNAETLEGCLLAAVEVNALESAPLFQRLAALG